MKKGKNGFTLIENLIAISVVAVVLPTVLAAIVMNYRAQERDALQYGSVDVAERVFTLLPWAWKGGGEEPFSQKYDFPQFSDKEELSLLFVDHETPPQVVENPMEAQEGGVRERAGYVVVLKNDKKSGLEGAENFLLEVSAPAGKAMEGREKVVYQRRYRAR